MNFLINTFFPNGWTFVMFFFMVVGLIGVGGGAYLANRERLTAPAMGVALVLIAFSYTFYQVTTSVITEQVFASEETTIPATTMVPEMVYTYGQDNPVTRAAHEQLLSFSSNHTLDDPQ